MHGAGRAEALDAIDAAVRLAPAYLSGATRTAVEGDRALLPQLRSAVATLGTGTGTTPSLR